MRKYNLVITTKCNKNCKYCFIENKNQNYELIDFSKFRNEVNLLGGEPLLHPELNKIIEECKTYNIKFNIMTNFLADVSPLKGIDCSVGASIGHIRNDDEYNIFISNFKYLQPKLFGLGVVVSNNAEVINLHSKYLKMFYDDTIGLLNNNFNICLTLQHPTDVSQDNSLDAYLENSWMYIEDIKNIILLTKQYGFNNIILGCGGIYRCMFKNDEDINFLSNNILRFHHGCDKNSDYPFFLQNNECYICPPAKKLWKESFYNFDENYLHGLNEKKKYNKNAPAKCQSCIYYNKSCYGPCLGFYNKI